MALTAVADLREVRPLAGAAEIEAFEVDVLAGFVLARAAAGLADGTIASDVGRLTQVRMWFDRPLWEMEPADADRYFAKVLGGAAKGTRLSRAGSLRTYFAFLELRHKVEIHDMTGRVVECPIDEMNRPRGEERSVADPAVGAAGGVDVRWVAQQFGDVSRVRSDCSLLCGVPFDRRRRAAGERVLQPRPRRHQVGSRPVRRTTTSAMAKAPEGPVHVSGLCR